MLKQQQALKSKYVKLMIFKYIPIRLIIKKISVLSKSERTYMQYSGILSKEKLLTIRRTHHFSRIDLNFYLSLVNRFKLNVDALL